MGQKTWAVGEEVLAADMNSFLQNQVIPQFASTAQRDSQWPSPPLGAVCITTDTMTVWYRLASTYWYKAYGRLAGAARTSDAGPTGTTDATLGVDITVTVPTGRLIRLEAHFRGSIIASGAALLRIKEGATVITEVQSPSAGASGVGSGASFGRTITPASGAHTYGLYVAASTGTCTVQGSTSYPITLEAFDVGAP